MNAFTRMFTNLLGVIYGVPAENRPDLENNQKGTLARPGDAQTVDKYAVISSTVASLLNSAILSKNIADLVMLGTADGLPYRGLQIVLYVFEAISLALVVVVAVLLGIKTWKRLTVKPFSKEGVLADTRSNYEATRLNTDLLYIAFALLILNIAIDCIRATIFGNVF